MYASLFNYLIQNGVNQPTAQRAVARLQHQARLGAPLSRQAARLLKAAWRAVRAASSSRGPKSFDRVRFQEFDQAIVLPGEEVTDEDEGEEYVAARPSPFLRARARNVQGWAGIIDDNSKGLTRRSPLSIPEIQVLALTVAAGL